MLFTRTRSPKNKNSNCARTKPLLATNGLAAVVPTFHSHQRSASEKSLRQIRNTLLVPQSPPLKSAVRLNHRRAGLERKAGCEFSLPFRAGHLTLYSGVGPRLQRDTKTHGSLRWHVRPSGQFDPSLSCRGLMEFPR